jgi:mannose-6-phosphate isomerase
MPVNPTPQGIGVFVQNPVLVDTIWAGPQLKELRGYDTMPGTSWEVSRHPHAVTTCADGTPLDELIAEDPALLGGHGMLRAGYLSTADTLSVQVHPDQAYAEEHEGDNAKTETWYIIDCVPGAHLVAGTSATSKEQLKAEVEAGTVDSLLCQRPVKPGDIVHVPFGTLHSMGANILAAEVGMDSDVTYRFYDYLRKDANGNYRPLTLKESLDVVRLDNEYTQLELGPLSESKEAGARVVLADPAYDVVVADALPGEPATLDLGGRPAVLQTVEGSGSASWKNTDGETETVELPALACAFVGAGTGEITLEGNLRAFMAVGN